MRKDDELKVTPKEISSAFESGNWGERFPPLLSIDQAAELIGTPKNTLYDWRSRGLLAGCSRKVGKRLLFVRDKLLLQILNHGLGDQ